MDDGASLPGTGGEGEVSARRGAQVAAFGYLLSFFTPFAMFYALPKLVVAGDAAQTSQNVAAHMGLLSGAMFAMLLNFVGDILCAWGLYVLLRPVNATISALVACFRVVYTAMGLAALLHLVTVRRLVLEPAWAVAFGEGQRAAQVSLALEAFQAQFDFSLILFGLYLVLLGLLMSRARYAPKALAVLVVVTGLGWIGLECGPYLGVHSQPLMFATMGELALVVWLVGWGSRLKGPDEIVLPKSPQPEPGHLG